LKEEALRLKELLRKSHNVIIVSHENPDGDAIGSAVAIAELAKQFSGSVSIWLPGRFPSYYRWMKGTDDIFYYSEKQQLLEDQLKQADLLIAVDISTLSRTGKMFPVLDSFEGTRVLIDHHIDPDPSQFQCILSDTTVSSTCELIYHLIHLMKLQKSLNLIMAEAIYVGIMTDTGSFSFGCNSPLTYEAVAQLVRIGISPDRIHKLVYDNNQESRIRLLGYSLRKMKVLKQYHTAYIDLDRSELEKARSQPGDTEGIVNFALSLKDVVLAAFFSVREGEIKISLRSKGNFSVNDFAAKHFNGGGHFNAAGGSFKGSMAEAIARFEEALPLYEQQLADCNHAL
jgi:bifunctional oligoribonuclease and PAP phosphatase NrnA